MTTFTVGHTVLDTFVVATQSMLRWLSILFGFGVLLLVLWKWILYPKYFSPLRRLPQAPGGSFLMGQFSEQSQGGAGAPFRRWVNEVPNKGLIRYLDIFNLERVAIVKPDALADVLVHHSYDFEKPEALRKGISRILGMGLFLAEGDAHKYQRKNLMPAFAFRHVKDLYPIFWAKARQAVMAISQEIKSTDGSIVEVNRWANRATLDIIGVAGMGRDFNAIAEPNNSLLQTYRSIFSPSKTGRFLAIAGFILPGWMIRAIPIKRNHDIGRASDVIKQHCMSLIEAKKQKLSSGKDDSKDILKVALESGTFTDQELVGQLMTFLAAGHETTASALTWVIYNLCKYPEIQAKLRKEIQCALPDKSCPVEEISSTTIDGLQYLRAVCSETLRLFPPVALTVRVTVKDTIIAGEHIPKGTGITLAPWAVNAAREFWGDDAADFVPERWLDPSRTGGGGNSNFSFMTFLHGPRSCIGEKFARGELACLVAAWVTAFDTSLDDMDFVAEVRGSITAKPKDGLLVRVKLLS